MYEKEDLNHLGNLARNATRRLSAICIVTALVMSGTSLTLIPSANAESKLPRINMHPTARTDVPEDHFEPSASRRLAQRGGSTIRVGSNSATCDFNNLTDALAAASDGDTILLEQNDALYLGGIYNVFNFGVTIRGGYENCLDNEPSGRTTLNANGQGRVLDLWLSPLSDTAMNVVLENLSIRGGLTGSLRGGAGILIEGRQGLINVELRNVEVAENTLTHNVNGGGIRVLFNGDGEGSGTLLTIDNNSIIQGNATQGNGGGLACDNPENYQREGTIIRIGAIEIAANSATNGGGLALDNCSNVFLYGGGPIVPFIIPIPTGAIYSNTATEKGGGLYVKGDSEVLVRSDQAFGFGNPDHAAHIVLNQASHGGGIYNDGAAVTLTNVIVNENRATEDGGGIYATGGATTWQRRLQPAPCEPPETSEEGVSVPICSRMMNNVATNGHGGAYYVTNGATLDVERTIITGNESALHGSVVTATSEPGEYPGQAEFSDVLVYHNRGSTLFYGRELSTILVFRSTITENEVEDHIFLSYVTAAHKTTIITVVQSIIWEGSGNVLTTVGEGNHVISGWCLIGHQEVDQTDFDHPSAYSKIDPHLITVGNKPFFPASNSPAIDYCEGGHWTDPFHMDLVGVVRGSEHQGPELIPAPNPHWGEHTPYDIGAYETEWELPDDDIFQDRFESGSASP